jgi:hypothetical protein
MDFVDFFCPIISSVVLEDNAPDEVDTNFALSLELTGTRTDGIVVPAIMTPNVYLDEHLIVSSSDPSKASVSLDRNTLNIIGLAPGLVTIHIKHRPDRNNGPQLRAPYSGEDLLNF